MARQFFSGKSLEQAVMAAAKKFNLDPAEVQYTAREKKHGFVNVRRRFVIEVDPEAPKKEVEVDTEVPQEGPKESLSLMAGVKPPRKSRKAEKVVEEEPVEEHDDPPKEDVEEVSEVEAESDIEDKAVFEGPDTEDEDEEEDEDLDESGDREIAAFLKAGNKLIDILDVELDVKVERRDDEYFVDFTGEEADLLTENDGKILQAIEQLMPRMVRGLVGQGLPCTIDCEGFKEDRIVELRELAENAGVESKESGEEILLRPMSPADRRVVHLALADDPDLETESAGDGFMKRVRIVPA